MRTFEDESNSTGIGRPPDDGLRVFLANGRNSIWLWCRHRVQIETLSLLMVFRFVLLDDAPQRTPELFPDLGGRLLSLLPKFAR